MIEINPEKVADVFGEAQDILGEQVDSDRFWEKQFEKETEGVKGALEDHIPSIDELSRQLEQEAAVEVGGGTERAGNALEEQIKSGRERVKKLLEGK